MAQRYFLTAESTYEDLRQALNTQLAYPNALGKSVFQTALYAPRDGFRRVLLAVDTDLPNYTTIDAAIAPLLASDAMEEIDEATYLAAVASATAGVASWNDISDKPSTLSGYGITDAGTAATRNVPATGNAGATEVVLGSDTRLTDQRVPTDGSVTAAKLATTTSAQLAGVISDETGTGALVFANTPTLTTPSITFSTAATVTAGSGPPSPSSGTPLTADYNVITLAAFASAHVTLPAATAGRRIVVVNRGANAVLVYPATGASIDGGAGVTLPVNGYVEFYAANATTWYSTLNGSTRISAVFDAGTAATRNVPATGNAGATEVVLGSDTRLTDAREWSASTIDQAEAEAGTATIRRAFTAQRVFQAIAAWWNASAAKTKLDGIATGATANATDAQLRDRATHTGTQAWTTITSTPTTLAGYGITDAASLSHAHSALDITSGTIATARLGSGTASASTFLRGDQTYAAPPVTSVDGATGAVTITKATVYEFTRTSGPAGATWDSANNRWTWSLPSDAKMVEFLLIGAGAGGGSGRRGAAGTARWGGGGGAGGNVVWTFVPGNFFTSSLLVTIPSGGAGGAARTTDDTNGAAGTGGGNTLITHSSVTVLSANGGGAGSGGTATAGNGGSPSGIINRTYEGGFGGNSSVTAAASGTTHRSGICPIGGGGGGGISTGDVAYAGASSGNVYGAFWYQAVTTSPTGGAASTTANAAAGGNATVHGAGGCGGGASVNGFNSGAGGNGGDGYARITVWS